MAAARSIRIRSARKGVVVFALLVALAVLVASGRPARAALAKPAYGAGDRWVYVLHGSLAGLPGMNESQGGLFTLGLTGIAEVDVTGPASGLAGGVRVETHSSGFLNGTFQIPGNQTIHVSGTFSSDALELWEGGSYLPVASNSSTGYVIDVSLIGISTKVTANLWLNATTAYPSIPPFNLSVGDSASAPFTADIHLASSFSSLFFSQYNQTTGVAAGSWMRQVLDVENVTVGAGTFSSYRLNESLGAFPGLAAVAPASGANETAWFSNDVGYYVRRVVYVNGTPAAEMRLKSYTYPAPTGGSVLNLILLTALPIAIVAVFLVLLLLRRRKRTAGASKTSSGAGPVGELPPKNPGGEP
jgi:hypothetical protein